MVAGLGVDVAIIVAVGARAAKESMLGYSVIGFGMRPQCEVILALSEGTVAGSEVVKDNAGKICETV